MTCDECASTTDVRLYDDPETDEPVQFCEACAAQILGEDEVPPYKTEAEPDDEFADTCITASDYYREGDY
ncbi:MAG: hypothetical protein ABIT01_01305 [Thermoanaerobaculia bacterium]